MSPNRPSLDDIRQLLDSWAAASDSQRRRRHNDPDPILRTISEAARGGADLDQRLPDGSTLLARACRILHEDAARALLRRGASPDLAGADGVAPLAAVASQERYSTTPVNIRNELLIHGAVRQGFDLETIHAIDLRLLIPATHAHCGLSDEAFAALPGWSPASVAALRESPAARACLARLLQDSVGRHEKKELSESTMGAVGAALRAPEPLREAFIHALGHAALDSTATPILRPDSELLLGPLALPDDAADQRFGTIGENLQLLAKILPRPFDSWTEPAHLGALAIAAIDCLRPVGLSHALSLAERPDHLASTRGGYLGNELLRILACSPPPEASDGEPLLAWLARGLPTHREHARLAPLMVMAALGDPMSAFSCELLRAREVPFAPSRAIPMAKAEAASLGLSPAGWKTLSQDSELRRILLDSLREALALTFKQTAEHPEHPMSKLDGWTAESFRASLRALSFCREAGAQTPATAKAVFDLLSYSHGGRRIFGGEFPDDNGLHPNIAPLPDFPPATEAQERAAFAAVHPKIAVAIVRLIESSLAGGSCQRDAALEADAVLGEMNDCVRRMPAGFWSGLDPREPLAHIRRAHAQWMEAAETAEIAADPILVQPWEGLLAGEAKIPGAQAAELLTALDLRREGKEMSHCVGRYADDCRKGRSRIFSLTAASGERSTLELAPFDGALRLPGAASLDESAMSATHWRDVQHQGIRNRPVADPALHDAARAVAELANQHWRARREAAHAPAAPKASRPR